jgi:hypothetical protein
MTRGADMAYHQGMRNCLCVAVLLVACSSDDGGLSIDVAWTINSQIMGPNASCSAVGATHVDWTVIKADQTMTQKSFDCSDEMDPISITPGNYIKLEGLLRSSSSSVLGTCDPSHDDPLTSDSHNVGSCVFDVL